MLKWFKKLTERLFSEDIADDHKEQAIEQVNDEIEEAAREERPTFRFPIITDAEIYGWENKEDDYEEVTEQVKDVENQEESDFNPVPLYQNDRWPGTDAQKKSATVQFERRSSIENGETSLRHNEKSEALKVDLENIQNRRKRQRFTPSQVPSPIYGYADPSITSDEFENNHQLKEQKIVDEVLPEVSPTTLVNKEEQLTANEVEASPKQGNEVEHDNPVLHENIDRAQSIEEEVKEDAPVEEESGVENFEEADNLQAEEVIENQVDIKDPEQTQPKEQQKKNDERVVPFNVLMLKSDKRQLEKRKIAHAIADEMTAKKHAKQSIIKEEQPAEQIASPELPKEPVIPVEEVEIEVIEEASPLAHYALPHLDYLMPPEDQVEDTDWLRSQSEKLEESLSHFGVQANVIDAVQGPTVTRFELTVGQGTKVSRVRNLTDDLKLTLAARDIRIEAPIPGKSSIGIEIPNRKARAVRISEVIQTEAFQHSESPLEAVLGLGLTGEPVTLDLRKMPHGMIAGATGSGKSVCINSILVSLLYKASPADLQMMLIDPKMVELAPFNGIPHLISPVITDVKAATVALKWAVAEMERRYELLAHAGVRDIERYNKQVVENRQFSLKMPYLLIVIDELADLMMMAPGDVEVSISRIAQKARACGIHLIIATQRPSVDVITGIIKANIPTRIAFSVSSQVDSRTMIDMNGAERLLGRGDMLYIGNGESMPIRLQGTFVTDDEIERIIKHVQNEASPDYLFGQDELLKSAVEEEEDPLFVEVCEFIYNQDSASTSMLQRSFSIGYNRAAKLMDRLEELSFISPQQGSKARDVYLTNADLEKLTETIL